MPRSVKKNDEDAVQEYVETLSKVGQELFSDFLSENSRNRQNYLLASSIIAILLSYTLISPNETDFGGVTFIFLNPDIPLILAGAICLYFLLVYGICVLQDWEVHKFKTLSGIQTIIRKITRVLDTLATQKASSNDKSAKSSVSKAITQIKKDHKIKISRLDKNLKSLKRERDATANSAISNEDTEKRAAYLNRQIRELENLIGVESESHNKLLSTLMTQDESGNNLISSAQEKSTLIRSIHNKYRLYNTVIVLFEVIFPIGLAIFALFATGNKLW